jgi:hypothetical protein
MECEVLAAAVRYMAEFGTPVVIRRRKLPTTPFLDRSPRI